MATHLEQWSADDWSRNFDPYRQVASPSHCQCNPGSFGFTGNFQVARTLSDVGVSDLVYNLLIKNFQIYKLNQKKKIS